jgi:2-dehydro-3-deoxy-D-arabinonate dehydratase
VDSIILFQTSSGPVAARDHRFYAIRRPWHDLVNDADLQAYLAGQCDALTPDESLAAAARNALPPIGDQEVWAAGVTYFRSRDARMEESRQAGGGDFYDRVYDAARPELFLKATARRVVGSGEAMHLRRDSTWIVPEPELVAVVSRDGIIVGYTIGNDLSCRDIEGENPLYLPQAKTFDRCAAIAPGILVAPAAAIADAAIRLSIKRGDRVVIEDSTSVAQMKRAPEELVGYLFRDNSHPTGCLLMTGTGIVPVTDFSLRPGDVVEIAIDGIGTLINPVE